MALYSIFVQIFIQDSGSLVSGIEENKEWILKYFGKFWSSQILTIGPMAEAVAWHDFNMNDEGKNCKELP